MNIKITSAKLVSGWTLLGQGALFGTFAAFPSLITVESRAADDVVVNMQLSWLASNGIIGEIAAKNLGFYAEEEIQLEVKPGGPGVDGVASVASGRALASHISSSPSLMLARSAGIPIKAFAAGYQKHPFTYFSLTDDPIREPKDLIGKTVATQPTAAILAKNGIDEGDVEIVNMGSDMIQLITGQASAVTGWLTNTNVLKVIGDDRVDMMLGDTGIQLYANLYYTTDQQLADHADVLVGFLRATARGWGHVRVNPEDGVDMLVNDYPNLDRESELEAIGPALGFSFDETTLEQGWETMNPDSWQAQIETYADLGQFEGPIPTVDDVMATAVLDATADIRNEIG